MNTFISQIQNYLPLLTVMVAVIGWFIRLETKTMANEKRLDKIEVRNEIKDQESDTFREDMKVTMQEVKTTLKYIQETLSRLERK